MTSFGNLPDGAFERPPASHTSPRRAVRESLSKVDDVFDPSFDAVNLLLGGAETPFRLFSRRHHSPSSSSETA